MFINNILICYIYNLIENECTICCMLNIIIKPMNYYKIYINIDLFICFKKYIMLNEIITEPVNVYKY